MSSGKRMEQFEAAKLIKAVAAMLAYESTRIEVAGSFRRERNDIGDVDLVVLPANLSGFLTHVDNLVTKGYIEKGTKAGGKQSWGTKSRLVEFKSVNFDIAIADEHNFGYLYWLRTGPGDDNKMLMTLLKNNLSSVRMSDGYLWHVRYDKSHAAYDEKLGYARLGKLSVPDEQTFFDLIGMPFCHPQWRSEAYYRRYIGRSVTNPPTEQLQALYADKPLKQTSFL